MRSGASSLVMVHFHDPFDASVVVRCFLVRFGSWGRRFFLPSTFLGGCITLVAVVADADAVFFAVLVAAVFAVLVGGTTGAPAKGVGMAAATAAGGKGRGGGCMGDGAA
jgi:hypothetical protein